MVKHAAILAFVIVTADRIPATAETSLPLPPMAYLADRELADAFGGKTIDGHYADGSTFQETYRDDGRIRYVERDRAMEGRWLVKAGTFCTIYDTSPTGGCFRVTRRGDNCFEFYFVARDEAQAERDPSRPSWTAQAWIAGRRATCRDEATV